MSLHSARSRFSSSHEPLIRSARLTLPFKSTWSSNIVRCLASVSSAWAFECQWNFDAVMMHTALRIVVEKFRIGAYASDRLNELDLRFAAPAESQMKPQRCRLAQICLVLKFRLLDGQKFRHA